MEKLDLTKKYKSYYNARAIPELVDIEPAGFLSIRGKGDPDGPLFGTKIQALYATAYTIKFTFKEQGKDFVVAKLEGLWWFNESRYQHIIMEEAPKAIPRSEWEYRLLIRMPSFVTKNDVERGIQHTLFKKQLETCREIEFFEMDEGKCVQIMHIGPFATEPESLLKMNAFMKTRGLAQNGRHHEIYLSDFRKTDAKKLRTILREPVKLP